MFDFARAIDLEHARSARALQRLQDDVVAMRLGEGLDVGLMPGDQGFGANLGREALEIELVDRPRQAVGIVENDHPALGRLAPEQDAGFGRPRHRLRVERGIAAQHQHVDLGHVDLSRSCRRPPRAPRRIPRGPYICAWAGSGRGRAAVVGRQHEIGRRDVAYAVPALRRLMGQHGGRIARDIRVPCR